MIIVNDDSLDGDAHISIEGLPPQLTRHLVGTLASLLKKNGYEVSDQRGPLPMCKRCRSAHVTTRRASLCADCQRISLAERKEQHANIIVGRYD